MSRRAPSFQLCVFCHMQQRIPALKRPTQKSQLSILICRGCVTFALRCLDICSCVLRQGGCADNMNQLGLAKRVLIQQACTTRKSHLQLFFFFFFLPLFLTNIKEVCTHTAGRKARLNKSRCGRKCQPITGDEEAQGNHGGGGNTRFRTGSSGTGGPSEMGSQKNIWCQQIFKFEHKQAACGVLRCASFIAHHDALWRSSRAYL